MDKITALPLGTKVQTKVGKSDGIITEIHICFNGVEYKIEYFDGSNLDDRIMTEHEFTTERRKKLLVI